MNFRRMWRGLIVILALAAALAAQAQAQTFGFDRLWPKSDQPWYFYHPTGVAVDASGNVIVADSFKSRIQVFDSNGIFLRKWGSPGSGDGVQSPRVRIAPGSGTDHLGSGTKDRGRTNRSPLDLTGLGSWRA